MSILTFKQARKSLRVFTKMWRYLKLADLEGACYFNLKRRYTRELIRLMRMRVVFKGNKDVSEGATIYVCNHISYVDIPLIMSYLPEANFVSKIEIASWPVIGLAAKRIGTVFVNRGSKNSHEAARRDITKALLEEKKKIIVFPSGTTKIYKTEKWKKGIFEIAQACNVQVIPLRLTYKPLRTVAYIDHDNFATHLYRLMGNGHLEVEIEFAPSVVITDPIKDCARIKEWCEETMGHAPASFANDLNLAGT